MREIKFRAWDGETMLDSVDVNDLMFACGFNYDHVTWKGTWGARKPDAVVMQYTGLKDKNGVEIYEGDIVKKFGRGSMPNPAFVFYVVEYKDNGFINCLDRREHGVEVIGNIYENPELLEES